MQRIKTRRQLFLSALLITIIVSLMQLGIFGIAYGPSSVNAENGSGDAAGDVSEQMQDVAANENDQVASGEDTSSAQNGDSAAETSEQTQDAANENEHAASGENTGDSSVSDTRPASAESSHENAVLTDPAESLPTNAGITLPESLPTNAGFMTPAESSPTNTNESSVSFESTDLAFELQDSAMEAFADTVCVYFISYASQVAPIAVRAGTTVGELSLPVPTRQGYEFAYWTETVGGAGPQVSAGRIVGADGADLLLYANWRPVPGGINYQVVYWVEKPNLGVNYTPAPGNPNDYDFGYAEPTQRTGTAGETVHITGMPSYTNFAVDHPLRYAQFQYSAETTLLGDNNNVIVVYCKLRVYTINFDLDGTSRAMNFRGGSYTGANRYSLSYKYEENISAVWPHPDNGAIFTNLGGKYFSYWTAPGTVLAANRNWSTPRVDANSEIMPQDPSASAYTVSLSLAETTGNTFLRYWAEQLPEQFGDPSLTRRSYNGKTYVLMQAYNTTASSDTISKMIIGMTNVGSDYSSSLDAPGGSRENLYKHFYYDRVLENLIYNMNAHGIQVPKATGIMYGQSLAHLNVSVSDVTGFAFGGWYKDAYCTLLFDFANSTMPQNDLVVYAKWTPAALRVNFVDADGSPLVSDGSQMRSVAVGATVNLKRLVIGGVVYEPGVTIPGKGVFLGWDWYAPLGGQNNELKTNFPENLPIYGNVTLYARWQTDAGSPPEKPDISNPQPPDISNPAQPPSISNPAPDTSTAQTSNPSVPPGRQNMAASTVETEETTTIADEQTPQAASRSLISILDPLTPISAPQNAYWALLNLIMTVVTGVLMLLLLISYFTREPMDADEEIHRHGLPRLLSIVVFACAGLLFLTTENLALPLRFTDRYTAWHFAIFAVQILFVVLSRKKYRTIRN